MRAGCNQTNRINLSDPVLLCESTCRADRRSFSLARKTRGHKKENPRCRHRGLSSARGHLFSVGRPDHRCYGHDPQLARSSRRSDEPIVPLPPVPPVDGSCLSIGNPAEASFKPHFPPLPVAAPLRRPATVLLWVRLRAGSISCCSVVRMARSWLSVRSAMDANAS